MAARIDSIRFGEITIGDRTYYSDMVVWWDGKVEYREKSHVLGPEEFQTLSKRKPEVIVIGKGTTAGLLKVASNVIEFAKKSKIDIYTESSSKAVELFNAFANDGKKVVAVIHTTS